MKLYYSPAACSLTIRIFAHELGIPCEFESVDLKTKKTETGVDFLTINAKGATPALVLDNGELLTENAVILQYLADQYQGQAYLPALGSIDRYRVLEWTNFVSTELHKGCGPFFKPQIPDEVKQGFFMPMLKSKLQWVEQHLSQHAYLWGDHCSIADIYLFVVLSWFEYLQIDRAEWPHVEQYFARLKMRKAFYQALQEEGLAD